MPESWKEDDAGALGQNAAAAPEGVLPPGTLVDQFRIMRLLARGGMGELYLARDVRLGRKVALKRVQPSLLGSEEAVTRFLAEARTTAKFSHPNIVTVYTVGEHDGKPYLALEYLEGENLRDRFINENRRLSLNEALRLVMAVAEALAEAHQHGVLHRDLKPENVVIPKDGRVRVVDFGLALRVTEQPEKLEERRTSASFQSETLVRIEAPSGRAGTPEYMAPEQWHALECTPQTDVWALGVMLFELCTGQLPFDEPSLFKQAMAVCSADVAPRADAIADVPRELADLVARCLDKISDARPDAATVAASLRGMVERERVKLSDEESPFRGLLPFGEQHAHLFFGRDAELAAFVERLRALPVLPVVGPSGGGKSSFVQAGIIPRLREQARWRVIQMRPSSRPFELLAARLSRRRSTRSVKLPDEKFPSRPPPSRHLDSMSVSDVNELAAQLVASPALLGIELRALALEEQSHVLLFVDALEELFALVPSEDTRARFIEAICSAADDPEEPVRVVFTVRDDFLGRLAVSADAREALAQVTLIQRLAPSALIETLERPVRAVGYGYEDPDLPGRMVAAVRNEPAGLPLLQFAGQRLWDERNVEQRLLSSAVYERMGGVEGALAKHADGVLAAMSAAELRIARAILLRLVSAEGTRRALARADLMTELVQAEVVTSEDESAAEAVLGRLTQARLVTVTRSPGDEGRGAPSLELAHESLIRRWHMLARWLDESKEERTVLAEITQSAELWDRRGRREEELWQASALDEALRFAERTGVRLPELAQAFIDAAEHRRRRGQRRGRRLLASAMLGLALIAVVLAFQKREADLQRNEAEERQLEAEEQRAEALRESAASAHAQGHLLEARAKLRMALERQDTTAARALWWQLELSPLEWDVDLGSVVYGVSISRDGRTIAAACQDKAVYLFDGRSAAQRVLRGHRDQVSAVALSPDGKRVASGSLAGELFLWDAATGKRTHRITGHEGRINALSFSADGSLLASASANGTLRISRSADGSSVRTLRSDEARHSVALSPDGKIIAAAGKNRTIVLFEVASGRTLSTLSGHDDVVEEVTFSPDGKLLASGSRDRTVRLWRSTGEHLRTLSGHRDRVRSVSFSGDGKKLASASHDRSIIVWDVRSGARSGLLEAHTDLVFGVRFAGETPLLVSGGVDKSIKLWRLDATKVPESVREGHEGGVYSVSFHDRAIVTAGDDRAVRVWDTESGEQRAVLRGHTAVVFGAAFSPDGGLIASGSADTTVRLWQTASMSEARALSGHGAGVHAVAFSPDGKTLASASADTSVRLWEVSSGREQRMLRGHEAHVMRASFSPDGRLLATSGYDGTVRIWDVASGSVKHVARGHGDRVYGVSFSPDGKTVASGGFDQTVRLIDAASGKELASTKVAARVHEVAFHPQGDRIAAATSNGSVVLWNHQSGASTSIAAHTTEVNALSFDRAGKLLATAGDDGTVRVWDVASARPHWRAPVLLHEPLRLLTHRGWRALGKSDQAPKPRVRAALEERAQYAEQSDDGVVCLRTYDGQLEAWDLAEDDRLVERKIAGLEDVVAVPGGCATRADGGVRIYARDGKVRQLALQAEAGALAFDRDRVLVAAGEQVVVFEATGNERERVATGVGVTALGIADTEGTPLLVVGYQDGNLELFALGGTATKSFTFEAVPSSAATRIHAGPRDSVIAGFANGTVGLWSLRDGKQLASGRLHGSIAHLVLDGGKLYAASTLGRVLSWELGPFYADRCTLLEDVWRKVPITWQSGRALESPPPSDHPCRR